MDLLRVISMLMVVCIHFYGHGGLIEGALIPGTFNWYAGNLMNVLCYVAVNCFVLLSGYNFCKLTFKLRRITSLWVQVFFYSVVLYIIACVLFKNEFSVKDLIKSFLPVTMQRYWFVSAYFLLIAVSPFLNAAVNAMNQRTHFLCCCTLLVLFSVLHNIFYISDFGDVMGGYSFLWFAVLYVVAAYIRLYIPAEPKHRGRLFAVYGISASLIAAERFLAYGITPFFFGRVVLTSLFYSYNSILMVAASLALFLAIRTFEVKSSLLRKTVAFFAPVSFGVYLIHEHTFIRPLLWGWLDPAGFAQSPWMLFYAVGCTIAIFLFGAAAEWCRRKLFHGIKLDLKINALSDRIQERMENRVDRLFDGH